MKKKIKFSETFITKRTLQQTDQNLSWKLFNPIFEVVDSLLSDDEVMVVFWVVVIFVVDCVVVVVVVVGNFDPSDGL